MADRKDLIFQAADELIGERGYAGVSVRDIAERAGVNKALVFYYFNSKDELYERVVERYYGAHVDALAKAFSIEGTIRERLHNVLEAYFGFMAENVRYARLVQQQVASGDPEHMDLIRRNLGSMLEWTEDALAEVTPPSGALAARQFFMSLSGMVINYFTYAPALGPAWGDDPLGESAKSARLEHLHWVADALLDRLEKAHAGGV
jgi:AcrR family transcriptional regulator